MKIDIGIDIGGTLSKLVLCEPNDENGDIDNINENIRKISHNDTLKICDIQLNFEYKNYNYYFIYFETCNIKEVVEIMKENNMILTSRISGTGGGSYKFTELFEKMNISIEKYDEIKCLIKGLNFMLQNVSDECYYISNIENDNQTFTFNKEKIYYNMTNETYPYLLVNIGSGVSIINVKNNNEYERVSGSCLGGGTYLGLLKMLTKCDSFEQGIEIAMSGDLKKVNMLVGDIYGGDYQDFDLKSTVIASIFGKNIFKHDRKEYNEYNDYNDNDISVALLYMIGANIAQIAYLNGKIYGINHVLFAGNFLRRNMISMSIIASSIEYWSKGKMKAYFLKHEGYFGCLGSLICGEHFN